LIGASHVIVGFETKLLNIIELAVLIDQLVMIPEELGSQLLLLIFNLQK
jgi:hypothetical protein